MGLRQVIRVARREALEQARQPVMLFVIASLFAIVTGTAVASLFLLQHALDTPQTAALLQELVAFDDELAGSAATSLLGLLSFLGFSQYLGVSAVLAGHAMIHERQCGTLTFLLLAPIGRMDLVAGKVIGALSWTTLLYVVIVGGGSLLTLLPDLAWRAVWLTPASPSWWIAFLAAGPVWAAALATACVLVSAVARDVRAAQQGVWFIVFFATLAAGTLLTASLHQGVAAQLVSLLAAVVTTVTLLSVAAVVVSRDVSR